MAATCACGTEPNRKDTEKCEFAVSIDTATCRFVDIADMFASDEWHVDLTGTASVSEAHTEFTAGEVYVSAGDGEKKSFSCPEWHGATDVACLTEAGDPDATTWKATVFDYAETGEGTHTFVITARASKIYSTYCQNDAIATKTVVCNK